MFNTHAKRGNTPTSTMLAGVARCFGMTTGMTLIYVVCFGAACFVKGEGGVATRTQYYGATIGADGGSMHTAARGKDE